MRQVRPERTRNRRRPSVLVAGAATIACLLLSTLHSSAGGARSTASAATGYCSKATANRVLKAHGYKPDPQLPVTYGVLCGPFLGAGSKAIVATLAHGVCWPIVGWALLGFRSGRWQLMSRGDHLLFLDPFAAVGSGFRETERLFGKTDTGCNPTDGTRTRVWRWNGARLVASRWTVNHPQFLSPDHKVWCTISDQPSTASCGTADGLHSGQVSGSGATTICNNPTVGCFQDFNAGAPVLASGRQEELYGFRCTSATDGITCVVAAGTAGGDGFLINKDNAVQVGG